MGHDSRKSLVSRIISLGGSQKERKRDETRIRERTLKINQTRIFWTEPSIDFDETRLLEMTLLSGARSSSVWAGGGPEGGPRRARRRGR